MITIGPASSLWWIVAWAVIGRVGLGFAKAAGASNNILVTENFSTPGN